MKKLFFSLVWILAAGMGMAQTPAPTTTPARMHVNSHWSARLDFYHQVWVGDFFVGQLGTYDKVWLRPGFRVGLEHDWLTRQRFRLYQDLMTGVFSNKYEERVFTLGTHFGYEFKIWKQLRIGNSLGLHYNLAKPVDVRYVYEGDKWVKARNTDPAISRWQTNLGLNLGWRFGPENAHPIDVFVNGSILALGPWQPGAGVPLLLAKSAGVGLRLGL